MNENAAAKLQRISELFDELHELDAASRAQRLAQLRVDLPDIAAEVASWLQKDNETDGVLDKLLEQSAERLAVAAPNLTDRSGQHIGPYQLIRRVGRGGMGEVYEASRSSVDFNQHVAIKLLRRGLDSEDIVRRFVRERRILAQLEHPGIARLTDGGVSEDGLPYLVMEFVDGKSLLEAVEEQGLDLQTRLKLFLQICDAVAYAHRRLIVHRDLKPSNVMLTPDQQPKLLDFGIAKLLEGEDEQLTRTDMRVMTPNYAAPEQILGQPISTATDVYALGIMLYELLTGLSPNQRGGKPMQQVTNELAHESVMRPSAAVLASAETESPQRQKLSRQLSGDLDIIVLHALKREPERRYQGAAEFADDLRRHIAGHPVRAQTDTMTYRMRKFATRHRGGVAATLLAVLGILVGLVIAISQAKIAREQADRAQAELQRADAMKSFTLSLFREQDPMQRGKPEPRTSSELIASGIERARAEFSGDPVQLSEVLNDLGEIQTGLGDYDSAVAVLQQALEVRIASFGDDSERVAETQSNLGAALNARGDLVPGTDLLERSARTLERQLGADAKPTLKAKSRLVMWFYRGQRGKEAIALARELLQIHERVYGPDAPQTLARLADIGTILEQEDELAEAEQFNRELIQRVERAQGSESFWLVRPLGLLGDLLRRKQSYAEAEVVYQRAVKLARAFQSKPILARLILRQGDLMRRMQRVEEADLLFQDALTLLPPTGPERADVEMLRAAMLRANGDLKGAAAGFLRSYHLMLDAVGAESTYPWTGALHYAATERRAGNGDAAEPLLLQAVAAMRRIAKPESYDLMLATMTLAEWRVEQGRDREAIPLFDEAIAIGEAINVVTHPDNLTGRLSRAASNIALKGPEEMAHAAEDVAFVLAAHSEEAPLPAPIREEAERLQGLLKH